MDTSSFRISELVLHNDHHLIALHKPAGIAVQGDRTGDKSLLDLAEIYAKTQLFVTYRIDRPVSGIVIFAKSSEAAAAINAQLADRTLQKTYLGITGNKFSDESGELIHHLKRDGHLNRSLALDKPEADTKEARLSYRYRGASERYFLYEIDLHTGRHHQIRAQLGAVGCPLRGDEKYGFKRRNRDRSIDLLMWKIQLNHPSTGEKVELETTWPDSPVWQAFK